MKIKAEVNGEVKIWVEFNMPYEFERQLNQAEKNTQRQRINEFYSLFVDDMNQKGRSANFRRFRSIPLISVFADEYLINELIESPYVKSITEVGQGSLNLNESNSVIGSNVIKDIGVTGSGQTIVVMDTGVDYNHPMLSGRVVNGACFSTNGMIELNSYKTLCPLNVDVQYYNEDDVIPAGSSCNNIEDLDLEDPSECDHGTHIAGIVAGNSEVLSGVAPRANILPIQVFTKAEQPESCDDTVNCLIYFDDDIVAALEHIYLDLIWLYDIASINMSFGGGDRFETEEECDIAHNAMKLFIDNLIDEDVSVVAASGNDGLENGFEAPGCISSVISVGATDNNSMKTEFSNAAPYLDIVAPGSQITSSIPGGSTGTMDGTSQTALFVSGTIALMKSVHNNLDANEIRTQLRATAFWDKDYMGGTSPPSNDYGYGRLDEKKAVIYALKEGGNVAYVFDENYTVDGTQALEFDADVLVLDGIDISFTSNAKLYMRRNIETGRFSNLLVLGEISGSASADIVLFDGSDIKFGSNSENNFYGEIIHGTSSNATVTFDSDRIFDQASFFMSDNSVLQLTDGASLHVELGTRMYLNKNTSIEIVSGSQQSTSPQTNKMASFGGTGTIDELNQEVIQEAEYRISLSPNYPNPFNPATSISYTIPEEQFVTLSIMNMLGRRVATLVNEQKKAGSYTAHFDASNLSSGVYFYTLEAGNYRETRKMLLIK